MYFRYLWALLRHKWFVFLAACKLGIPWLGLVHDWTKFLPSEFIPYARFFYGDYPTAQEVWRQCPSYTGPTKQSVERAFDAAWNCHQKRNRHHWQYWMLTNDSDEPQTVALSMPDCYRREMLADWRGAGRAYGNPNTSQWYEQHKHKIIIHADTRAWIENQVGLANG